MSIVKFKFSSVCLDLQNELELFEIAWQYILLDLLCLVAATQIDNNNLKPEEHNELADSKTTGKLGILAELAA